MNGAELIYGEVFSDAFRRFKRATVPIIAFVVGLAAVEVVTLQVMPDPTRVNWWYVGAAALVQQWLWWSMIAAALATSDSGRAGLGDFRVSLVAWIQLLVITLVTTVPIALGMVLLIIPGIYLALMWSQTSPLLITGRARWFGALGMSVRMTRGNRGRIFVLYLVPVLFAVPAQLLVEMLPPSTVTMVLAFVWTSVISAYLAFIAAEIYERLVPKTQ